MCERMMDKRKDLELLLKIFHKDDLQHLELNMGCRFRVLHIRARKFCCFIPHFCKDAFRTCKNDEVVFEEYWVDPREQPVTSRDSKAPYKRGTYRETVEQAKDLLSTRALKESMSPTPPTTRKTIEIPDTELINRMNQTISDLGGSVGILLLSQKTNIEVDTLITLIRANSNTFYLDDSGQSVTLTSFLQDLENSK